MRSRPLATLALLLLLPVTAPFGARTTGAAEPATAPPCDGIRLEKITLDMTRAQVEALQLGKIEVLGQTSDEARLEIKRSKGHEDIRLLLHHDRVVTVTMALNADKTTANAFLTDLKTHWGEPEKVEDVGSGRMAWTVFTWSRKDCPAYGGYIFTGSSLFVVLSPSADLLRYFHKGESDLPEIIR